MQILKNSGRVFRRVLALSGVTLIVVLALGGCVASRGTMPTPLDLGAGVATPKTQLPAHPPIAVPIASAAGGGTALPTS